MSGVDPETCNEIKPEALLQALLQFVGAHKDKPHLTLRACALFLAHYNVPEKAYKDLQKKMSGSDQRYRQALETIRSILTSQNAQSSNAKKLTRSKPVLDERGKREYRAKRFESKNRYGVLRSYPEIVQLIKNALSKNLEARFDKIGIHRNDLHQQNTRLIVFVIGGLSVNEVAAAQQFQKNVGKVDVLLGTTEIFGAEDFIDELANFNEPRLSPKSKVTQSQKMFSAAAQGNADLESGGDWRI